jgi:hypothetical protein
MALSVPFRMPSVQLTARHTVWQLPLVQSLGALQV